MLGLLDEWSSKASRGIVSDHFMPLNGWEHRSAAALGYVGRSVWLVDVRTGGYAKITDAGRDALFLHRTDCTADRGAKQ